MHVFFIRLNRESKDYFVLLLSFKKKSLKRLFVKIKDVLFFLSLDGLYMFQIVVLSGWGVLAWVWFRMLSRCLNLLYVCTSGF